MSTTFLTRLLAPLAAVVAVFVMVGSAPATAASNNVVRSGSCSSGGSWKLKAGPDNGRIELEGEVDTNHAGQTWNWSIRHNGTLVTSGTSRTVAPSGSFSVRRVMPNLAGTDSFVFFAKRPATGQTCTGRLNL